MQSKGAIRLFAIIFALVCLYQLSFTFIANRVEKNAQEAAAGDPEAERRYLDSIASEPVYNLLVRNYTYREVKDRVINLGLDLQGGMNVTLEVSAVELIRELANNSQDPTFNTALARAIELQKTSQEDFVTLFGRAFNEIDPQAKLSSPAIFGTRELAERIKPYESTNPEVLSFLRSEAEAAYEISFNVLRNRIDKFGVSQPNIQKLGTSGRILVELPGVKEKERVRKLLQGTAKLEFFETHENRKIYPLLEKANEVIKEIRNETEFDTTTVASAPIQAEQEQVVPQTEIAPSTDEEPSLLKKLEEGDTTAVGDTLAPDKQLVELEKEYPLFAVLTPSQAEQGPVVGMALIRDTAKVNRYLSHKRVKALFPPKTEFMWTVKPFDEAGKALQLIAINPVTQDGQASLEGDVIVDARQTFGQFGATPEISMTMNAEGARKWKELTRNNIGSSIAIVLDDYVYSFPTVQGEIPGGQSSITGNFTITEAKDLANVLKAGKLPAPARIVEEAVVGPSLGEESVRAGLISFILALILVLIYMVFWYSFAGFTANFALLANIFFIFGVLASLGAVLTLPGIAGIVLIIGMSVDANVLIFERIREELATGKGLRLAIEDGYKNAYSSIIDANVTSLLTGIILYTFGTGPIRGFATVLVIGILTSLFAAIFLTRLIFLYRLDKNKSISFFTKFSENAFKNLNIDFVSKRKIYYMISGLIIAGGIISFAARGLNMGVDFVGGRSYVVRFDQDVNTINVRSTLTDAFGEAPEVKTFGGAQQVKITTKYLIDSQEEDADQEVENTLVSGLTQFDNMSFEIMSSQKVGPTVANDIKAAAIWAILFSLLVIFLYIILRFKRWQFGLGALVAIFHDVLIVLACFSLFYGILPFSLEIDQAFIAAILTVIGYSINDTVVVFDRIREYLGTSKKREMNTLINESLNSTISRTFNTSFTIFIVLLAIFIFGGEVIRGFSFALLVGIVVGTYSSICIATPIVIDFSKKPEELK
ncbi:MAG: protein translocase subunit SecDF [Bacteroidota bacterium]|nr:protein translocase subunit SecDF [Bacteroidota bacterium]